ncbi:6-phosphogluconolactonase [bacterium A37T11]|nr:6-phosphogluconolactonase [bacterium A37T11]
MIKIFEDAGKLSFDAAERFVEAANEAVHSRGRFTVALTGGSSPIQLYKLLAAAPFRGQVPWEKTFIFWGDERWVPLEDERSNAKMAYETLLNHVPVPKKQIFPMWARDKQAEEYALLYEQKLKDILGEEGGFDLILLGMGDDGHTASLFPGTDVLQERDSWVSAYYLDAQQMYRITLTAPVINKAKQIFVITYGTNKAHALYEVLQGERNTNLYPAQLINPLNGEVIWMTDKAGAEKLKK